MLSSSTTSSSSSANQTCSHNREWVAQSNVYLTEKLLLELRNERLLHLQKDALLKTLYARIEHLTTIVHQTTATTTTPHPNKPKTPLSDGRSLPSCN
jgi:hypothetical protein